jgi:arylformamidase
MTGIDRSDVDLDKLNREYSPSRCIDDINVYIQQYIDLSIIAKNQTKELSALHSNQPYDEQKTSALTYIFL